MGSFLDMRRFKVRYIFGYFKVFHELSRLFKNIFLVLICFSVFSIALSNKLLTPNSLYHTNLPITITVKFRISSTFLMAIYRTCFCYTKTKLGPYFTPFCAIGANVNLVTPFEKVRAKFLIRSILPE